MYLFIFILKFVTLCAVIKVPLELNNAARKQPIIQEDALTNIGIHYHTIYSVAAPGQAC
jgi:hypothetical protein